MALRQAGIPEMGCRLCCHAVLWNVSGQQQGAHRGSARRPHLFRRVREKKA